MFYNLKCLLLVIYLVKTIQVIPFFYQINFSHVYIIYDKLQFSCS